MNKSFLLLFFFATLHACTKDDNLIPDVPVSFRIQASELGGIGTAIYTQEIYGLRGIIIYHNNTNEYVAYERACTYRPSNSCEVVQLNDETNPSYLTDNCCNSNFLLDDGTPFSGPALRPLKQYNTTFDGTYIYVSN